MKWTKPARALSRGAVALGVVLTLLPACSGGQRVDGAGSYGATAEDAYETGRQYQSAGNFAEAAKAYTASLEQNPKFVLALYNLALVQLELGQKPAARDSLVEVVHLDPGLTGALATLATLQNELGNPQGALEASEAALAIQNDLTEALIARATALDGLGRQDDALAAYEQLVKVGTGVKDASIRIAVLLIKAGKVKEGTDRLRTMVASFPDDIELKVSLGRVYFTHGKFDNAIEVLKRAVDQDQDQGVAQLLLGRSYLQRGQEPLALISLQKAEALLKDNAEVFVALGEVELRRGYTERALENAKRALALDGNMVDAHLLQADIFAKMRNASGVNQALGKVLEIDPMNLSAARKLAQHLQSTGKASEAAAVIAPFAASPDAANETRLLAADLEVEAGQIPSAVAHLASALEAGAGPEVLGRMLTLAMAREDKALIPGGDLVGYAERYHQGANGGTPDSLLILVDALVFNNEKERAKEILKAAAKDFRGDKRIADKARSLR